MKRSDGFTLIELLITMIIMAILMTVAVVNLRGTQANARDEERKSDVAVIARNIEMYYNTGNGVTSNRLGHYPGTSDMSTEDKIKTTLRDIDTAALRAPGVASTATASLANAVSANAPTPTVNDYIYQPLTSSGTLCTTLCTKFVLYYQLEKVADVQMIVSKNQ